MRSKARENYESAHSSLIDFAVWNNRDILCVCKCVLCDYLVILWSKDCQPRIFFELLFSILHPSIATHCNTHCNIRCNTHYNEHCNTHCNTSVVIIQCKERHVYTLLVFFGIVFHTISTHMDIIWITTLNIATCHHNETKSMRNQQLWIFLSNR